MIKRKKQKITSQYGRRGSIFHKGVDLRCYNFSNWKKQPVIFPEYCRVIRIVYQEKWGWTVVCRTKNPDLKDYELKFIHLEKPLVVEGSKYQKNELVGWTTVTDYMKHNKMGEHLHFEVWDNGSHIDPTWYFDERGIKYG